MTQTLRLALCATVIAAGCGGGGGEGGSGTPQTCGNGSCDTDESCGNCGDCACPTGQRCSGSTCVTDQAPRCGDGRCQADASETCVSCVEDCGCDAATQVCSEEYGVCVSNNPLIETIPGTWDLVELNGQPPPEPTNAMLTTDTSQPLCGYPDPPQVMRACEAGTFRTPSSSVRGSISPTTIVLTSRLRVWSSTMARASSTPSSTASTTTAPFG